MVATTRTLSLYGTNDVPGCILIVRSQYAETELSSDMSTKLVSSRQLTRRGQCVKLIQLSWLEKQAMTQRFEGIYGKSLPLLIFLTTCRNRLWKSWWWPWDLAKRNTHWTSSPLHSYQDLIYICELEIGNEVSNGYGIYIFLASNRNATTKSRLGKYNTVDNKSFRVWEPEPLRG